MKQFVIYDIPDNATPEQLLAALDAFEDALKRELDFAKKGEAGEGDGGTVL